jgi:predicted sugar kinase
MIIACLVHPLSLKLTIETNEMYKLKLIVAQLERFGTPPRALYLQIIDNVPTHSGLSQTHQLSHLSISVVIHKVCVPFVARGKAKRVALAARPILVREIFQTFIEE